MTPSTATILYPARTVDMEKAPYPRCDPCLVFALLIYAAAHVFELPPHLLQFGLDHPDWEVDDLIFVVFIVSAAVIIYGVRRYREVVRENAARIESRGGSAQAGAA